MSTAHRDITIDQFTRQAAPYARSEVVRNEDLLRRIVELAEAEPADAMLDVACGPGLLVCAYGPHEGDEVRIRSRFESALADDLLDVMPRRAGDNIAYGFPIAILKARKAAARSQRTGC